MMAYKRNEKTVNYINLIKSVKAPTINFEDVVNGKTGKVIRHDVDRSLQRAIDLATVEHEYGIRSTYFLLHSPFTGKKDPHYFDYSRKFKRRVKSLVKLGHYIGLHDNIVVEHLRTGRDPKKILERPLNFLRDAGIEINGTASHGDLLCIRKKFHNAMIWKEYFDKIDPIVRVKFNDNIVRKLKLILLDHADFKLKYHVNFLYPSFRASLGDGGGRWSAWFIRKNQRYTNMKDIKAMVINKYNKGPVEGVFQFLIHPYWWRVC